VSSPPGVLRVREALLRYFDRHPQAMDALEGIGMWWGIDAAEWELDRALEQLVREGEVDELGVAGRVYYRRHPQAMGRWLPVVDPADVEAVAAPGRDELVPL